MKIWAKYLGAILVGLVLGLFLPLLPEGAETWDLITRIIIGLGRLVIFPMVFFSVGVAVQSLRMEKKLISTIWKGLSMMILSSVILVVVGAFAVWILTPQDLSIQTHPEANLPIQSLDDFFSQMLPLNGFLGFVTGENALVPIYFFGFFLGMHFNFDREITRPAANLFDSLSQLFYHANSFLVEIMALGLVALSMSWFVQIRSIQDLELFSQFLILIALTSLFVIFALIPLALLLVGKEKQPYKILYGLLGPALISFFSGDQFFNLGPLSKHLRENLGVRRKYGATTLPFYILFGRAGTAMISSMSFLMILLSYRGLEINPEQVFWTLGVSILLPFVLSGMPRIGVYGGIYLMTSWFGSGIESWYLLIAPIVPILVAVTTLLDSLVAGVLCFLGAKQEGLAREIPMENYI